MLGALYVGSLSPVLALMLTAALVPGALLLGARRSELASWNVVGWAGGYFQASDKVTVSGLGRCRCSPSPGPKPCADNSSYVTIAAMVRSCGWFLSRRPRLRR